jgi:hypothetical protein
MPGAGSGSIAAFCALAIVLASACGDSASTGPANGAGTGGAAGSGGPAGNGGSAGSGGSAGVGGSTGGDGAAGDSSSAGSGASASCPDEPPAPVAGDVLEGDLLIATPGDAESASSWSEITGTLRIASSYPGVLDLPNLVRVGGDVFLEGNAVAGMDESTWAQITELRLPNLASIGGQLYVYLTAKLVETDFRSLESVGYRVYYMRNLALRRIGLDSLSNAAASTSIQASPEAASCEIEAICGGAGCGEEYSDADCTCEVRCGRLEPHCAAWD